MSILSSSFGSFGNDTPVYNGEPIDDILFIGDSNTYSGLAFNASAGYDHGIDVTNRRCIAFATGPNRLRLCSDPLDPNKATPTGIGPMLTFMRDQYVPNLLPAGHVARVTVFGIGGTSFLGGVWKASPLGTGLTLAQSHFNTANAIASGTLKLLIMSMGANDAINNNTQASFVADAIDMVAWFRANLVGGTNVPFLCCGLSGAYVNTGSGTSVEINAALASLPDNISNCGFVDTSDTIGTTGINYHFCNTDQRTIGNRFYTQAYLNRSA